ncbi:MAG TPA: glycosyltransferase family 39 protein [Terriglobales bacterium]|nr:glycosyltransferase family 39 protein [Terriglobales bacterium]
MLSLIRRNKLFFLAFTVLGFLLRGTMLRWHFLFEGDSLVYGDLAKNWLLHGVYGLSTAKGVLPVNIRMPGYPAFLLACFRLFGVEHYSAVVRSQLAIDLLTCFLIAAGARRLFSDGTAKIAFVLATLCPFLANYTATPLPETPAIFAAALALLFALRAVDKMRQFPIWDVQHSFAIADWIVCGAAIAFSIYLRPDGGVLLIAIGIYLVWLAIRLHESDFFWSAVLLAAVSLLPLLPWAIRNWRTLHEVEPLAPFYAQLPGEYVPKGFNRWTKTWVIDFYSVMNVEWNVTTEGEGETVDLKDVPARAYDNAQQQAQTQQVLDEYNQALNLTPAMDAQFAQLARERIQAHPVEYYVGLPLARLADIWLRPRTETLNLQLDWWNWEDTPQESAQSLALAALNFFYLVAAFLSLRRRLPGSALLWLFIICRSILLATLPNPEPRYTLECFPAVLMLAGAGLGRAFARVGRADLNDQYRSAVANG